jgi:hypothetical protein
MGVLVQLGHFSVESDRLSAFVYGEPASLVYAHGQSSNGTKDSNKRVKKEDSARENSRILHRILKQGFEQRSRTLCKKKRLNVRTAYHNIMVHRLANPSRPRAERRTCLAELSK